MNPRIIFSIVLTVLISLVSCKRDNDILQDYQGDWTLGTFKYNSGSSSVTIEDNIITIFATTIDHEEEDPAAGSGVTFKFNDLGAGEYNIVENVTEASEGKVISFNCTIGTATNDASRYVTTNKSTGTATLLQFNGYYFISINTGVTLFKSYDLGEGVANSEDSYLFTANRVN